MNRGLGWILAIVGAVLIVAGGLVMLVVVPGMKKLPADTDTTRHYEGTLAAQLDPATFTFVRDVPIELTRHFAVVETDGDLALVKEERTMTSGGKPIQQVVSHYAIDRSTMLASDEYADAWAKTEGFIPREGLVLSWPMDTEKKDQTGWSDDYMSTVPLVFDGEVTHERSGMKTYLFTSKSGPRPIDPAMVAAMGLPTELPRKQLEAMVAQANLSPLVASMLPKLLASIPGDTVPLAYYYAYEGKYWIDPATGIIVDTEKHEVRKAGIADEVLAETPLANLPEEQKDQARVAVSDFTYTATDQSVDDARADAEDAGGKIRLYGTVLPGVAVIVGAGLLVIGVISLMRKPKATAAT